MLDFSKTKQGDPVCLLKDPYIGRIGYFYSVYPFPDGDMQCTVTLIDPNADPTRKSERILIYKGDAVAIASLKKSTIIGDDKEDSDIPANNIYKIGQRVIISSPEYRGCFGVITKIIPVAGGCLTDYRVDLDHTNDGTPGHPSLVMREEDLVPASYMHVNVKGIDLGRFLSRDFLFNAAEDIYEQAIKEHINKVIEARCFGSTTLTDWIISDVAKQFANELAPRYKEDFIKKIKAEIAKEVPKDDDQNGETFHSMFTMALEHCASQYISDHNEEIGSLMLDSMKKAAEKISIDTLAAVIRRKVNIDQIVRDAFAEEPEEGGSNGK